MDCSFIGWLVVLLIIIGAVFYGAYVIACYFQTKTWSPQPWKQCPPKF